MDALTIEALEFMMESPFFISLRPVFFSHVGQVQWIVEYRIQNRKVVRTQARKSFCAAIDEAMRATGWKSETPP